jgi:biotin transport system substrate-specific component
MVPLPYVPITLQLLFVLLSGALLGACLGALSQALYILLGVMGLPVFAGGAAGLGYLLGPTGGYLFGFIPSAFITGKLIEIRNEPGIIWTAASMMAGVGVIYALGVLQLSRVAELSIGASLIVGVYPFLIEDMLKVIAAAFIAFKIKSAKVLRP